MNLGSILGKHFVVYFVGMQHSVSMVYVQVIFALTSCFVPFPRMAR